MNEHDTTETAYRNGYADGKPKWISVKERIPGEDKRVIVYLAGNKYNDVTIDTDRLHENRWVRWGGYVTHWMPLPEKPEENERG